MGIHRDCSVFRAYIYEDPAPRILLTWPETESFSSIVMPRIVIEDSLLPPANGDSGTREGHLDRIITISSLG